MGSTPEVPEFLPGTLELLILKILVPGPHHGYRVAQRLKAMSDEVLQVGESCALPRHAAPAAQGVGVRSHFSTTRCGTAIRWWA